jgi:hypothetical protein
MIDEGAHRGSILLDPMKLRRFTDIKPAIISINAAFRPERQRVEDFIEATYRKAFSAKIQRHFPTLISAQDESGQILAAAGFRFAQHDQLYLESYLDEPIEASCRARGINVRRREIAEIGNLSSAGRGASIFLFLALASHLEQRGVKIAAATATRRLRRMFQTVKFESVELGEAGASHVAEGAAWGAYYEHDPIVLAGEVKIGRENLQRLYADQPALVSRLHPDCGQDY